EEDLGDIALLAQLAGRGHIGMQLAETGDGFAVHHGACSAAGMKVFRGDGVEVEVAILKWGQQLFDVALHVEEAVGLRSAVNGLGVRITGRNKRQASSLVVAVAELFEDLSSLEE